MYATGFSMQMQENFQAWLCKVVSEVKGLNPSFDAAEIRGKFYFKFHVHYDVWLVIHVGPKSCSKVTNTSHNLFVCFLHTCRGSLPILSNKM